MEICSCRRKQIQVLFDSYMENNLMIVVIIAHFLPISYAGWVRKIMLISMNGSGIWVYGSHKHIYIVCFSKSKYFSFL